MTKTMKITLTEDFLVPTDDGNIIFEPGDEIEVEYEDNELTAVDDTDLAVPEELPPIEDTLGAAPEEDPLSFAANPDVMAEPEVEPAVEPIPEPVAEPEPLIAEPTLNTEDDDEVYIEDPTVSQTIQASDFV